MFRHAVGEAHGRRRWRWPRRDRWGTNPGGLKTQERIGSSRATNHRRPDERIPGQVRTPEGAFESSVARAGPAAIFGQPNRHARQQVAARTWAQCSSPGRSWFHLRMDEAARQAANDSPTKTSGGAGGVERHGRPAGGEKPLKGEPHERYRRETKPEGIREEESVKGLRKPVGVAQPGMEPRCRSLPVSSYAGGAEKPPREESLARGGPVRVTPWSRAKSKRGSR